MAYLIKNIKKLVQVETKPVLLRAGKDMQTVKCIDNAFLLTDGDKIAVIGNYTHNVAFGDILVGMLNGP